MPGHDLADRRSLALHQAVADRLAIEPTIVERARAKLEARAASGDLHPQWAAAWRGLLALPTAELIQRLRDDSPSMRAARQASPFAGALSATERWTILRGVGAR